MLTKTTSSTSKPSKADVYLNVASALMLRDMRTRFGGSHLGYVVAVMWPVVHIFVLVVIFTSRGIQSPLSVSTPVFIATGAVPFLMFQYISREVMKGCASNKPLLYYPQVKMFDLFISRSIVEIVSGFMGVMLVLVALAVFGINPLPFDPFGALCAYSAAIFLGIGIGAINISIVAFFPGWQMGYVFFTILNYMVVGIVFMPSYLPDAVYYYLRFNPLVQIVEWMRVAYEPSLNIEIDYLYIILWIFISTTLGLFLERFVTRKMN